MKGFFMEMCIRDSPTTDARAVPIYATTSYVFHDSQHAADRFGLRDAGNIYGRLTNPTQDIFEQRIASLEGGVAALATASGAAAITYTIQALARQGEHIVAAKTIYGGTYNLLAHTLELQGITTTFVDPAEDGAFEAAIQPNTKAIFIESLGNPNSNIIDIEALAETAHKHNIPLVVDSTFATPYPVSYTHLDVYKRQIQNRANTLALWCMFAQVFPLFQDASRFTTVTSVYGEGGIAAAMGESMPVAADPLAQGLIAVLSIAVNVFAFAYILRRAMSLIHILHLTS